MEAVAIAKGQWVPKYTSEEIECTECICGYSCGTTTALHRHLDKNPNRRAHAAKAAGSRGKQWVASGSVKQRSELFEKRIQEVVLHNSTAAIGLACSSASASPDAPTKSKSYSAIYGAPDAAPSAPTSPMAMAAERAASERVGDAADGRWPDVDACAPAGAGHDGVAVVDIPLAVDARAAAGAHAGLSPAAAQGASAAAESTSARADAAV